MRRIGMPKFVIRNLSPLTFGQRAAHGLSAVGIVIVFAAENVRKKEQLEYGEYHNQFDDDNRPQLLAYGHRTESVGIEAEHVAGYI